MKQKLIQKRLPKFFRLPQNTGKSEEAETMRKEGEIKVTRKLIKQLKPFWREFKKMQSCYDMGIAKLEERMAKKTGIENIEFFFCHNEIVGIGNVERTMRLIRDIEL